MVTQTKTILCPRCGKPALSDHGEPYCMTHGTISPEPISEPKSSKHNFDGQTTGVRKAQLTVNPDFEAALAGPGKPAETKELPIPPRPATKSRTAIHEYYETNKERIIADHNKLGAGAAVVWSIPRSQYDKLIKLWTGRSPVKKIDREPKQKKSESPPVKISLEICPPCFAGLQFSLANGYAEGMAGDVREDFR